MRLQLAILDGPFRGHTFPLSPGRTSTIGRNPSDDLFLPDPAATSRHCLV